MKIGGYKKALLGAVVVQALAFAILVLPVDASNQTVFVGEPRSLAEYSTCGPNGLCGAIFPPISDALISPGDSVTWVWLGGLHSVTSETGSGSRVSGACATGDLFDSGPLGAGGSFSRQFDAPGTCFYFCSIHGVAAGAEAKVVVGPASTSTTATSTTTTTSSSPATTTTTAGSTTTLPGGITTTIHSTTSTLHLTSTTVRRCDDLRPRGDQRCLGNGRGGRGRGR
jgi:hypothetical protein